MQLVLHRRPHFQFGGPDIQSVQTGTFTIPSGDSGVLVAITAVIKNKAFLIFNFETTDTAARPDRHCTAGRINSGTQVEFIREKGTSAGAILGRFWVVEFTASSSANVQHISHTRVSSTLDNIAINSVDLAHTFPLLTWTTLATGSPSQTSMAAARISSFNNVGLRWESTDIDVLELQVIENPNWDVTKYEDNMATGDFNENTGISAINIGETWLVPFAYPDTGESGTLNSEDMCTFNFSTTTSIEAVGEASRTFDLKLIYYVIESNGKFSVQGVEDTIINGQTTETATINAVDTAKSCIFPKSWINSRGVDLDTNASNGDRVWIKNEFGTNTQAIGKRDSSTDDLRYTVDVIDFSNSF